MPANLPFGFLKQLDPARFTVAELMALLIIERGGPMGFEELATGLAGLGVERSIPSLKKAWHSVGVLRKTVEGKLELAQDEDWQQRAGYLYGKVKLERMRSEQQQKQPESPEPDRAVVPDTHTPLTREEWQRFLEEKPSNFSLGRWVATLADTVGGKIPVADAVRAWRRR